MRPFAQLLLLAICLLTLVPPGAGEDGATREGADQLYRERNFKEALDVYRRLLADPAAEGGEGTVHDLEQANHCLRQLNRLSERDDLLEEVAATWAEDWRVLESLAEIYWRGNHYGYLVAGTFHRGHHRGGGKRVSSLERDRVRALQLMQQAMAVLDDASPGARGCFHLKFAQLLLFPGGYHDAWRLQALTDLSELPDYESGYHRGGRRGAPVDAAGGVVFHALPASWAAAASDGQRWRWQLARAEALAPTARSARKERADFARQQFGVQTLAHGAYGPQLLENKEGPWSVVTLSDAETLCKTAGGIQRFDLPPDYNYLVLYRDLGEWDQLATVYENRAQFPKAAATWAKSNSSHAERRRKQIVGNWGRFEPVLTQPAGEGASIEYRFRNGKRVDFTAYRLKAAELLKDVKALIRSRPQRIDWQARNVDNLGWRVVHKNQKRYLDEQVATWSLDLDPLPDHFSKHVTVRTPLQQAGAYLLVAEMAGGNTSRVVVWLADTALVHKPLAGRQWYYVADAVSGEAVAGANLAFFGWRQRHVKNKRYEIDVEEFAEHSGPSGQLVLDRQQLDHRLSWLVTATTDGGRFAYLGFQGVWYRDHERERYRQTSAIFITDRPVYRPDQTVHLKTWLRQADYAEDGGSTYAGKAFTLKVHDARGEELLAKRVTLDAYGGCELELPLAADAALGVYRLGLWHGRHRFPAGGSSFRVEEYKKPEFEVAIEAPEEPVALGEEFAAVIRARYYFGAPVTEATVHYKVHRSTREHRWYPPHPWDWLYGPGYWWFAPDYAWYPGWRRWGWPCPTPWWWYRSRRPPELVAEAEVPIGADGTVTVPIDTALAAQAFGDDDHEYRITAEVVDNSRRTIVGNSEVMVADEPFRITAWVDRGYYRAGQTVRASFAARTVDGKPVPGDGILVLYRVTYDPERRPVEEEVGRWELAADADGRAVQLLTAGRAGQYRLSYRLTDGGGHEQEGGHLFTVIGDDVAADDFRFNAVEVRLDRAEYAPGDTARLLVNADRPGATVMLFLRPAGGVYLPPEVVVLDGRSATVELPITRADMPNCFVEALTVGGAEVHTAVEELIVPPERRILEVAIEPGAERYEPGAAAEVLVRVTDPDGEPVQGAAVVSIYDKAVEYVSGGTNVPEIRAHFWKWRRRHRGWTRHNLGRSSGILLEQREEDMSYVGIFDRLMVQVMAKDVPQSGRKRGGPGAFMGIGGGRCRLASRSVEADAVMEDGAAVPCAPVDNDPAGAPPAAELVQPTVRSRFADTAFWAGALVTDARGEARVELTMPENLTTWKVRAWSLAHGTRVGQGEAEVITAKDLLVRMQAPRFFVERDEVVLSANVHNYLAAAKRVTVGLETNAVLELMDAAEEREVEVPAGGEARVDWRVRVAAEGEAVVTMKALTDEESDAMRMRFPAKVHGMLKTESWSLALRPEEEAGELRFSVPAERRPEQSELVLRYSPTLAGSLVDALPYLVSYPYGCTEQTLNRFLPTAIVQHVLIENGIDLAAVREKRANLNAQEIGDAGKRAAQWKREHWEHEAVFDEAELARMVKAGVKKLTAQQIGDGGWGWFSGYGERSYPHTTAVVVHGLQVARANDVAIVPGVIERGVEWLERYQAEQVGLLIEGRKPEAERGERYKLHADNLDALIFMVLADADVRDQRMLDFLYEDRSHLAVYGLCTYALALNVLEVPDKEAMLLRNIEQYLQQDDENQTAWLELGNEGYWWYWYGSEIEAHAYYLKLLAAVAPKAERTRRLVKYLLNNRKHATYWNSTRDTALCIEAMADYLRASGEALPDLDLTVALDGEERKTVHIDGDNLFSFDDTFRVAGEALTDGEHILSLSKTGTGPLYTNLYVTNFTTEEHIAAAGLEVKARRRYYRLERDDERIIQEGGHGQVVEGRREDYRRVPLENLSEVRSGDLLLVELALESKNDYEYICVEDPKPAGCEPVDLRSGYVGDELHAYREFRDDRVTWCVRRLARGTHSLSYRVRAEIPGRFSALPTRIYGMYAPELRGNSDEIKLRIEDRPPAPQGE